MPELNSKGVWLPTSGATTRSFIGTAAKETLYGTAGNDGIRGQGGGDTMVGGAGDDTYTADSRSDVVIEKAGEGVDTINAVRSYWLPDNVENLNAYGYDSYGQGNALANILRGFDGAQTLNGGGGDDVLIGGAGADVFIVERGGGSDVINDFQAGAGRTTDTVRLKGASLYTFDQVKANMVQSGADVVLSLGGGESLTFRNHKVADFAADDFQLPIDYGQLTLTFNDDFNSFDRRVNWQGAGVWNTTFGPGASYDTRTLPGNREQQYYVDPEFKGLGVNPFSVSNGVLTISANPTTQAQKDAIGGSANLYTSGLINTRGTFSQTYGYFEMRADLPGGQGLWPAFWLLPQDGSWPPELDVMEMIGSDPTVVYTTAHSKASGSHTYDSKGQVIGDSTDGFHTYGARWDAKDIVWYVDGVEIYRSATPADMNKPMYMLANLAVGGSWPGSPDETTQFPAQMHIDYIRAYSLAPSGQSATTPTPTPTPTPAPSVMVGGEGADVLIGGAGPDVIDGRGGPDVLEGGLHDDQLYGGAGSDTASYAGASGGVTVNLGLLSWQLTGSAGWDLLSSIENLRGSDYADQLVGDAGNNVLEGGLHDDQLNGGAGSDTASYAGASGGVTVNLGLVGWQLTGAAGWDALASIENVTGSNYADTLTGDAGDNVLEGGLHDDQLYGGAGSDTASYAGASGGVTVNLGLLGWQLTGAAGWDLLNSIENLTGSSYADQLVGDAGNNVLEGGLHDDQLNGGLGSDTASYAGASGGVTINLGLLGWQLTGAAGWDALASIENVIGSNFNDTLRGDDGANVLTGAAGDDVLFGGGGDDVFVFQPGFGKDLIGDFVAGGSEDMIDLRAFMGTGIGITLTQSGADAVFTFSSGDVLTVSNVSVSSLVHNPDWTWS